MRQLPVLMPAMQVTRSPARWREVCFFLTAFGAVFLAALLLLDRAITFLAG